MAFAGNRLMINQDHRRYVREPVKQFPSLRPELADRPVVAGRREHDQNSEARQPEPGKRLRKALEQSIPITLVEDLTGEMDESVNARGYPDVTAMPIQSIDNRRARKEHSQRGKAQHGAQRPDGELAGYVQQSLNRIGAKLIRNRGKDEKPNADPGNDGECYDFLGEDPGDKCTVSHIRVDVVEDKMGLRQGGRAQIRASEVLPEIQSGVESCDLFFVSVELHGRLP